MSQKNKGTKKIGKKTSSKPEEHQINPEDDSSQISESQRIKKKSKRLKINLEEGPSHGPKSQRVKINIEDDSSGSGSKRLKLNLQDAPQIPLSQRLKIKSQRLKINLEEDLSLGPGSKRLKVTPGDEFSPGSGSSRLRLILKEDSPGSASKRLQVNQEEDLSQSPQEKKDWWNRKQNFYRRAFYISIPAVCLLAIALAFLSGTFSSKKPSGEEIEIVLPTISESKKMKKVSTLPPREETRPEVETHLPPKKKDLEGVSEGQPEVVKDGGVEKILPRPKKGKSRIEGSWGSGPGQFGRGENGDGGPRSFFVDGQGKILVLDQENYRIQIFDSSGKFLKSLPLTNNSYEYFVVDPQTSRLALYNSKSRKVEILNANGSLFGEIPLPKELGPINNLWYQGGEVYLERGAGQYYKYSEGADPIPLPGKPVGSKGVVNVTQIDRGHIEITCYEPGSDGQYSQVWQKTLPLVASEITSYQTDEKGNIFITFRHYITEERNGQKEVVLNEMQTVQLDSQGNYLGDIEISSPQSSMETQKTSVSPGGGIYQMTTSSEGVRISSFSVNKK